MNTIYKMTRKTFVYFVVVNSSDLLNETSLLMLKSPFFDFALLSNSPFDFSTGLMPLINFLKVMSSKLTEFELQCFY